MAKEVAVAPDYPVPETDEQEVALERALATARKRKLEAVRDFLEGEVGKAFTDGLAALNQTKLPESSTKANVAAMVGNMATITKAVSDEIAAAENIINPPPPPEVPRVPLVPAVQ